MEAEGGAHREDVVESNISTEDSSSSSSSYSSSSKSTMLTEESGAETLEAEKEPAKMEGLQPNNLYSPFKAARPRHIAEKGSRKVGFVLNPSSGGGSALGKWMALVPKVRSLFGEEWKVLPTHKRGDAVQHTKQLIREGYNVVVSVGGDGTHNEVINGYLQEDGKNRGVEFGILPYGTGGDLQRTMALDRLSPERQIEVLAEAPSILCDAGVVRCQALEEANEDGKPAPALGEIERYFINISSVGVAGDIVYEVEHSWTKSALGGRLSFMFHTIKHAFLTSNKRVRWRFDQSTEWQTGNVHTLAVSNGQYQGGGMRVCPPADMYDGKFDVVIFQDVGVLDLYLLTKIYSGGHIDPIYRDKVSVFSCKSLQIEPLQSEDVYIEADGELPGKLPATYEVLPEAVWLIAPIGEQ